MAITAPQLVNHTRAPYRKLTTFPREKVKVLAVLYDGGEHAKQVNSSPSPFLLTFTLSPSKSLDFKHPHHSAEHL